MQAYLTKAHNGVKRLRRTVADLQKENAALKEENEALLAVRSLFTAGPLTLTVFWL